jgi:hypothetical protein
MHYFAIRAQVGRARHCNLHLFTPPLILAWRYSESINRFGSSRTIRIIAYHKVLKLGSLERCNRDLARAINYVDLCIIVGCSGTPTLQNGSTESGVMLDSSLGYIWTYIWRGDCRGSTGTNCSTAPRFVPEGGFCVANGCILLASGIR